jgi:hypothetical protein
VLYEPRYFPNMPALGADVEAPQGTISARFDLFTTGHGFKGPRKECDEFCQKENVVSVDGVKVDSAIPWTECCDNCTPMPGSTTCMGKTWNFQCKENPTGCPGSAVLDRGGWCPGRKVKRRSFDLSDSAAFGVHRVDFTIPQLEGFWAVGGAMVFYR